MNKKHSLPQSRRQFLKQAGSGLVTFGFFGCAHSLSIPSLFNQKSEIPNHNLISSSPVDRSHQTLIRQDFSGDEPHRAHSTIWNKKAILDQLQSLQKSIPTEESEIVIIGGGISGLMSSYFLRDRAPILLEQAHQFGGNSKAESWEGVDYAIGAAYVTTPEPGSPIDLFWKELGITQRARTWNNEEHLFIDGKLYSEYWSKGTHSSSRSQFQKVASHFRQLKNEEKGFIYPDIPTYQSKTRSFLNQLDQVSLLQYIENLLDGQLHSDLRQFIEYYCWTAFGGSAHEISAAMGLNFLVGELDSITVFPGGNAGIAEATFESLKSYFDKNKMKNRLRPSSIVFHIEWGPKLNQVFYIDENEQLRRIQAKYVILSCPKYVVKNLMTDLEPERIKAIHSLKYRSYIVGSALVEEKLKRRFFDTYFLPGRKHHSSESIRQRAKNQGATDVILGSFASTQENRTVLTLSQSLPYDDTRQELLNPSAYEEYRKKFESQLKELILPALHLAPENLRGIKLARWGHPLPLSATGLISNQVVDWLHKPYRDSIYFIEQDNWALPCFETAFFEAKKWTSEIRSKLQPV